MAVHIRRGDIVAGQQSGAEGMTKRWRSLDYFKNIVRQVSEIVGERLDIYLFSQGDPAAYKCFEEYGHVIYCFDMSDQDSFLHMVRADILVISKSSFSYKPALLSDGIKICPPDFWHGYPDEEQWVVVDEEGNLLSATSTLLRNLPFQSGTHRI